MIKTKFFILLVILFLIHLVAPTSKNEKPIPETPKVENTVSPLSTLEIASLDSVVHSVLKRYRFNGNALVAYKGFPVVTYSSGFRDLYTRDSLTINTVFQIASVSKSLTAAAVLILQQNGLLKVEDPVIQYVPDFPFPEVTIRQMLHHTSGLQNYMYFVDHYWHKDSSLSNRQALTLINSHNPQLNFMPGNRHQYNNTGYAMLALVVEEVSEKRFHQFLKEEIFVPLQMKNTFVWNRSDFDSTTNKAAGFTPAGRRYRKFTHNPLDEVAGDKSVYSTVEDLLKWDQALYTNYLLTDSSLKESFQKGTVRRGREFNYGYGWRLKEVEKKKVIYHHGLWNGFTSSLSRYIDDNITIILLNNTNAPVASIVREIYAAIKPTIESPEQLALELENN
jgi:CubicO group peptidase (beta-lactamase class C family)